MSAVSGAVRGESVADTGPGVPRQVALVAMREVRLEIAGREATVTVLPFVVALLVLAGLAFGVRPEIAAAVGPGLVWFVVLVAALPLARGVAAAEYAEGAWDVLRALTRPTALLGGKLTAMWLWLLACWLLAVTVAAVLLDVSWPAVAIAGGLLGTFGLAVSTVVLGVLLPTGTRRPGLLAVLLFPGAVPVLVAGTQLATPGVPALPWLALLASYDAITLLCAWAVFPALLEE